MSNVFLKGILRLKNYGIFNEHLTRHPVYPSLRSLSDTFDEWHIPNMAVKISPIQLSEISYLAMAYCKSATDEYYVLFRYCVDDLSQGG